MKITVNRKEFVQGVKNAALVADKKSALPMLRTIKLQAYKNGNKLEINAARRESHCEVHISQYVDAVVPASLTENGSVCIHIENVLDICKTITSSTVTISSNSEDVIVIETENESFTVAGKSDSDFPEYTTTSLANSIYIAPAVLVDLINSTAYAAVSKSSKEQARELLKNVRARCNSDRIEFASCDGHRIAYKQIYGGNGRFTAWSDKPGEVLIPAEALKIISKICKTLKKDGRFLTVYIPVNGDGHMQIRDKDSCIAVRLPEGEYLQIDKHWNVPVAEIEIDRKKIIATLKKFKKQNVKITLEGNTATFSNADANAEVRIVDKIEVKNESNFEIEIRFNPKYMIDTLKAIDVTEIKIGTRDPSSPIVITPAEQDEKSEAKHLIFPVRL